MFTGLIQQVGSVIAFRRDGASAQLSLRSEGWELPLATGESIAVQGVCLTLTKAEAEQLHFDLLGETLERTNLGSLQAGDPVNLERALHYGDPMGGHIVQGHVDDVGMVSGHEQRGPDQIFSVDCKPAHLANMVMKGSVCLDGMSLTIADLTEAAFTVHIIPHTLAHTSISRLKIGSTVNVETDVLAKYAKKMAESGRLSGGITWEKLKNANDDQY